LGSDVVRVSMSVCIVMRRCAAFHSSEQNAAAQHDLIDCAGQKVFGEHHHIFCTLDGERCLDYQARRPAAAAISGAPSKAAG
jgi:hypothetical protein